MKPKASNYVAQFQQVLDIKILEGGCLCDFGKQPEQENAKTNERQRG